MVSLQLNAYFARYRQDIDHWIRSQEIEKYSFGLAASCIAGMYDLIHAQDVIAGRAFQRVKPDSVPLVLTTHGCLTADYVRASYFPKQSASWKYSVLLEKETLLACGGVICPSRWLMQELAEQFGIPDDRLVHVQNGIDFDRYFFPIRQQHSGPLAFICIARLIPEKGLDDMLDAFALLKRERSDWVLRIVGDGPMRGALESRSCELAISDHVHFLGSRENVPELLGESDVFVLSSRQENNPFAIIEAQAAGLPVVTTDAGGLIEMIVDGENGLLSPVGSSEAFYGNVKRIMEDPGLRSRLSDRGQRWAAEYWSLDRMVRQTLDAYEMAIRSGS